MTKPALPVVAIAQMHTKTGDVRSNLAQILAYINEAKQKGAALVVFPELATSGYMLGDRWEYDPFIKEIERANEVIAKASVGITVIWGSVVADWNKIGEDGRVRKYNAACIAQGGAWHLGGHLRGFVPKTNLPKYRIFDDARHFFPAAQLAEEMGLSLAELLQPFVIGTPDGDLSVGVAVCEDLWENEYNTKPSVIYKGHAVDLLIDISQSPWTHEKWHARDAMLTCRSRDAGCPILYVNSVGLQNNAKNLVWFDGNSAYIDSMGVFRFRAPQHEAGLYCADLAQVPSFAPVREHTHGIAEIYDALIHAMRAFLGSYSKVIIGLSGGADSAVSAALLSIALGRKKIIATGMPSVYNSQTTQQLARMCAANLGIMYKVVPIQGLVDAHVQMLREAGYPNPSSLVLENVQARIRSASVLAAIAQAENGVFVNNGNKTEVSLNYLTLYGDGAGACAFLADLWKGQIYQLAEYINMRAGRELIPQGIIDIVPSAELSSEQNVDEGKGDPIFYPYHDNLLRMFIERRWDPTTVLSEYRAGTLESSLGCAEGTITRYFASSQAFLDNLEWAWRQYNIEWKRTQLPPVFITSRRAFGFDRRDTIAEGYLTDEYYALRKSILASA